ncbi:MAG: 30S ribosomal protein S13 [Anaerolineaceae bacterium]|nr:30S ribosomal protein S13 [Anaerolineaceae bacterium]MCY3936623.1 30S ribosomal protein S13 [Chloroflexota bacterium]MCY4009356.1 30S ribosomal protein S13 [Anaerolineaceae bacterium]MCY4106303.1 30S ribosomal protein S13 [Chloroflexota bacterium]
MARIEGVDLPREKRVEVGLTYIYGVGRATSRQVLVEANVDADTRVRDLAEDEVQRLRDALADRMTEGDLRRRLQLNIKRLMDINCYRGRRHRFNLPSRGQRTRTNARTRRGTRKTVPGRGRRRGVAKK